MLILLIILILFLSFTLIEYKTIDKSSDEKNSECKTYRFLAISPSNFVSVILCDGSIESFVVNNYKIVSVKKILSVSEGVKVFEIKM